MAKVLQKLSREAIIGRTTPALETEEIEIPEWGGTVLVRAFTGEDADIIARVTQGKNYSRSKVLATLVQRGVVDPETGNRIFGTQDLDFLAKQPMKLLNRITTVLTRLNGGDEIEAALEKNLGSDQTDDSPSD